MPIVVGYALNSEIENCKYPYFRLYHQEAKNYGLNKKRKDDLLFATYILSEEYDKMSPQHWDNTYVMDERNIKDKMLIGI